MAEDCFQHRRFEGLEERLREVEQGMAALSSNIQIINDNMGKDIERSRGDMRERLADLKEDMTNLETSVESIHKSLQNLYITQSGADRQVNFNEKAIWAVVGLLTTVALYLLQDFIKAAGAG